MNIGFIGFGKMAQAMCQGILISNLVSEKNIFYTDKSAVDTPFTPSSLSEVLQKSNVIFLCVKPQNLNEIGPEIKKNWPSTHIPHLISILAGKTLETLEKHLGTIPLTRVMPNTPATVNQSMSAFAHNTHVSDTQKHYTETLLKSFGKTLEVQENQLDIVTAISGSGPAFLYRIAKSIAETGQAHSLSQEAAITLIAQTLIGAGHMMLESGKSPETLIKDVSSPNGTTVAGLEQLEKSDIDTILKQTIESAYHRSQALSKEL